MKFGIRNWLLATTILATASVTVSAQTSTPFKLWDPTRKEFAGPMTHRLLNLALLQREQLASNVTRATVPFVNFSTWTKQGSLGSALIVQSQQYPDRYYVITAAHAIEPNRQQFVSVPQGQGARNILLRAKPVEIDPLNDAAILLINSADIRAFEKNTGNTIPAISSKLLSDDALKHKEAVFGLGYPDLLNSNDIRNPAAFKMTRSVPDILSYEDPLTGQSRTILGTQFDPEHIWLTGARSASGGPIIALRNGQPRVMGIISAYRPGFFTPAGIQNPTFLAGGIYNLPAYFQRAEDIVTQQRRPHWLLEKLSKYWR